MPKHGTPAQTNGIFVEFAAAMLRALPRDLEPELMLELTKNGEALTRALRKAFLARTFFTDASHGFTAGHMRACVFSVSPHATLEEAFNKLSELGYRLISASDILSIDAVTGSACALDPIRCGPNGEIKICAVRPENFRIEHGMWVKTTLPYREMEGGWTEEARLSRRWGVKGVVKSHHNSHGLCYEVRHEDGTTGYYHPNELEVLP